MTNFQQINGIGGGSFAGIQRKQVKREHVPDDPTQPISPSTPPKQPRLTMPLNNYFFSGIHEAVTDCKEPAPAA